MRQDRTCNCATMSVPHSVVALSPSQRALRSRLISMVVWRSDCIPHINRYYMVLASGNVYIYLNNGVSQVVLIFVLKTVM